MSISKSIITTILFVAFIFVSDTNAQKYKYGKVSKELLALQECDFYKNSNAMITFINGEINVNYEGSVGFLKYEKIRKQVKIFDARNPETGNTSFYYYSPKNENKKVKVLNIKGVTYNLDGDKITETKINKENIHETQINDYYKKVVVTMPQIRDNSVYEFEYEIQSEYITQLDNWDIQMEYPVLYNEYNLQMPAFFIFRTTVRRGFSPSKEKKGEVDRYNSAINRNIRYNTYDIVFEKIHPFEVEPFMTNPTDYIGKVTQQLVRIDWPNEVPKVIAITYDDFNKTLLDDSFFGKVIKKGSFIKDYLNPDKDASQLEIARQVLSFFQNKIQWDGTHHFKSGKSGNQLFKAGKGDTGDINLNYIAALNEFGISTFPVILSTRGHGSMHSVYPNASEINYVVAVSAIDDKLYFSDASSILPFGFLPIKCLNYNGYLVNEVGHGWLDLKKEYTGKHTSLTEIVRKEDLIEYQQTYSRSGYFAFKDQTSDYFENSAEYQTKICNDKSLRVQSFEVTDAKIDNIKIKASSVADVEDDDIIYIKPFLHLPYSENPFTRESRISNVDFPFREDYKFVTTINLMEGETFEAPEKMASALHEDWIVFKYNHSFNESTRKINVVADFKINKTVYDSEEYSDLKEAFEKITNKLNEPFVIRKL